MKISDKRSDILQAALELIAEQGFHGAPMAEIAEQAGVAAGTIYRYFKSKDALITELRSELIEQIVAALRDGYPSGSPLRERFLYLIEALFRHFIAHPLHFRYLEQYFNSPYGIQLHRDRLLGKPGSHDIMMDIFEQGTTERVVKDFPKAVLFSLAFGPMIALLRDHIAGFVQLDEDLIARVAKACWDAIKRRPPGGEG